MAELIGALASGITLAGLFRICVDAFDIIRTCKKQGRDLKKLTLRLNIERCRLYNWGEAMRLTQSENQGSPLDDYVGKHTVQETLEMIFQLLNDTEKIESRYGCRQCPDVENANEKSTELEGPEESPVTVLAASFSNFGSSTHMTPQTVHKTRWVVHDRKKFGWLMVELKDLVDGLQDITKPLVSVARLESMMRKAIRSIKDVDTLTLVSEVTEEDHPDLSVTASNKADTISTAPSTWQDIAGWNQDVRVSDDSQVDITEELEGMDITELKTRLLRQDREQQHGKRERAPPAMERPMYRGCYDNQHLGMSGYPMSRPEMAQHCAPRHATYQRPLWLQNPIHDHTVQQENFSPQQLYERIYRLKLEACAAEQAAKDAAAKAAPEKKDMSVQEKNPDPKAPIMFRDAYNRIYKLPFEFCTKWRSMEKLILQAHQGFDAARLVAEHRYDLLGPSGEVIMPHVWEYLIEPGWDITLKPWPEPEHEPEPPPPLNDSIITLDDILNPKNRMPKKPMGKSRSGGGFASWMSGGTSSKSVSGSASSSTIANSGRSIKR